MSKEPENIVLRRLGEIRATLAEQSKELQALPRLEKQIADLTKLVTYSLGQSTQTQFRQTQQEGRIDELFEKLDEILSGKQPV
jgi:t-SNARE complex subunit (syntaxin)